MREKSMRDNIEERKGESDKWKKIMREIMRGKERVRAIMRQWMKRLKCCCLHFIIVYINKQF